MCIYVVHICCEVPSTACCSLQLQHELKSADSLCELSGGDITALLRQSAIPQRHAISKAVGDTLLCAYHPASLPAFHFPTAFVLPVIVIQPNTLNARNLLGEFQGMIRLGIGWHGKFERVT